MYSPPNASDETYRINYRSAAFKRMAAPHRALLTRMARDGGGELEGRAVPDRAGYMEVWAAGWSPLMGTAHVEAAALLKIT
jgi:hypothetical protein